MGVSGSGKTSVGRRLAKVAALPFFDADDFHPQANVDKMASGHPLNDEDRLPWLQVLADRLAEWSQDEGAVLACSALKEKYRQILTAKTNVHWVYLGGSFELIHGRLQSRSNHYMGAQMLQSQFDALEPPTYGLQLDVAFPIAQIVDRITTYYPMNNKANIGLYGLGVMGTSLARNITSKGWSLSVYNRTAPGEETRVQEYLNTYGGPTTQGHTDVAKFLESLERPRKIIVMVPAGKAIDMVIDQLKPLLEEGDILMDCGNSHYEHSNLRMEALAKQGIQFFGVGVSGGEYGALHGPSIMIGGDKASYTNIKELLAAMAADDKNGEPCAALIGPGGSGHFVKMVHNGIEYAEMQLLAELYGLLNNPMDHEQLATLFETWNKGTEQSFLLGITASILQQKEGAHYLLDKILDKAANKGTGSWSSQVAMRFGVPNTMMSEAVFARYVSSFKETRQAWNVDVPAAKNDELDTAMLLKAYAMARKINHHQGFELIRLAAKEFGWEIDLSETARIWTRGCIIQSTLMETLVEVYQHQDALLQQGSMRASLVADESHLKNLLSLGLEQRIALPCFSAAWNYWVGMTTGQGPANLIQAQRDHFGGHTYQRNDKEGTFTTNWENHG